MGNALAALRMLMNPATDTRQGRVNSIEGTTVYVATPKGVVAAQGEGLSVGDLVEIAGGRATRVRTASGNHPVYYV